ncbi:MAG: FTR1 family iron permease [Ilumatobacteraceae bacterium]
MGSSLVITLREGLEASLIIAILLTYLRKTGRQADSRAVWLGTGLATLVCLVAGILINVFIDGLHGKVEQAVEGFIALAAVGVLTYMIFWMRTNSHSLGAHLRGKVDRSTNTALFTIAFVAVLREGLETVLFLLGAETQAASRLSVVVGGLIGLVVAIGIGVLIYNGSSRINLKTFFSSTAVLLLLFAAGLAGKAVHELRELIGWESGWLVASAWTIESGILAKGTVYDFMKGLLGWHASPERIRVLAYVAYLIPILTLYRRKAVELAPAVLEAKA